LNGDQIASIVFILAALVLAWRGLRARPAAPGKRMTMALVWLVIIVALVFTLKRFGLGDPS